MGPGGSRGLQIRWRVDDTRGGFDSYPFRHIFTMAKQNPLREIPSVEQLVASGVFDSYIEELSRPLVVAVVREALSTLRGRAKEEGKAPAAGVIKQMVKSKLEELAHRRITRVINATGIMIHTNLGRAPLGQELFSRVADRVSGYSTLEFDLNSGKRGKRGSFLSWLFAQLTGAEAALVVNNNAAAVYLILNTFANRKEVVISRSELVQIGGDFRIPDIMRKAGAKPVEVGATNKTLLRDYERAISAKTTMLLKVHRSNFNLVGFVEEVEPETLAKLAHKQELISVFDLGSGAYHQTEKHGMEAEPNVTAALRSGVDLVCFSGDKLLGAVQAGVILGSRELIARMNKNPMYRALRPDKVTLALAEEVVFAYLKKQDTELLPLWRMISTSTAELKKRATAIKRALADTDLRVEIINSAATPGGGSLPGGLLKSIALAITPSGKAGALQRQLLDSDPPLIGYIEQERLLLDLRTIFPNEDETVIRILREVG